MEFPGYLGQVYVRNSVSTFDRLAQVRDYNISLSADTIDAGHRDNYPYGANLPGLRSGEVTLDVVWDFNQHRRIMELVDQNEIPPWRIDWNDGTGEVWEFSGGISKFEIDSPYGDVRSGSITVQIRGRPKFINKADPGFTM